VDEFSTRYVSRLTKNTLALVLAGGRGSRLHELTQWRAKPALYFGGKYRIIDFPLSNCINSGIRNVGVLTQYKSHSLVRHLVRGWSHFKKELGEGIEILPASQRYSNQWYLGTADAIWQNMDIIRAERPEYVLVLSGDHVYKMDYGELLAEHFESGADMTVSCLEVSTEEAAGRFGVIEVDSSGRIVGFEEKPAKPATMPGDPTKVLASMGNYVFNTDFLFDALNRDALDSQSSHDFGHDLIPRLINLGHVQASSFRSNIPGQPAYWRDVGTLDSYWEANMELVDTTPRLDLYDFSWPLWTYQEQSPPAKFVFDDDDRRGMAVDSMVSGGCIISGSQVKRSVLFSNVRLNSYSSVKDSLILPEVKVGRKAKLRKCIIDRSCEIPEGIEIGVDHDHDRERGFRVTEGGVVLVTRGMLGQQEGLL
jgi:glucose-1-phosphate adenylyltransferase